MKKILSKKGFTLIELIVVIAILAILALILIPSLTGYIAKATEAKDSANARSAYSKTQVDAAVGTIAAGAGQTVSVGGGTCTFTVAANVVDPFVCVMGSGTYSLASNFAKVVAP